MDRDIANDEGKTDTTKSTASRHLIIEHQAELFPLKTTIEFPNCLGSADAWGKVQAVNGKVYVAKGDKGGLLARASEVLAAGLCRELGLPIPPLEIIETQSSELLFGSEEIGSISATVETTRILTSSDCVPGLGNFLSAVFAFDMFIGNNDRHEENFISKKYHGNRIFFLIDHARSLFSVWPLIEFPPPSCNTRRCFSRTRSVHGFDLHAAEAILTAISGVARPTIIRLMSNIPEEWLKPNARSELLNWWGSPDFHARLQRLLEGLRDGTLL